MLSRNDSQTPTELLTVSQIAAFLNVHPNTVRRWDRRGLLNAYRIGPRGVIQKTKELQNLEKQINNQNSPIKAEYEQGNRILHRMRELIAETGPVELRSVGFSEQ